jgi:hypothetical protein
MGIVIDEPPNTDNAHATSHSEAAPSHPRPGVTPDAAILRAKALLDAGAITLDDFEMFKALALEVWLHTLD